MSYVDGFVAAVPNDKKDEFIAHAREMAALFKKHGAVRSVENWGDDVPPGEVTSFPLAVQCGEDETVVFSWIAWPSKEARDTAWTAMMPELEVSEKTNPMPFDGKRMIFGGFQTVFES